MKNLILHQTTNLQLADDDRRDHILIAGGVRCGMHQYVCGLIKQDISTQRPNIIIDPIGNIGRFFEHNTEASRVVILKIGVDDTQGINVFKADSEEEKNAVVNTVLELMYSLYDRNRTGLIGPRFEHALRHAILSIFYDDQPTFAKLIQCFTDADYISSLIPKIDDPIVKRYWTDQMAKTNDFHKSEVLDYIVSKFSPFVTDKMVRKITTNPRSVDLRSPLTEGKTIIMDLSAFAYSEANSRIINTLTFSLIKRTLQGGISEKNYINLYIDVIERFDTENIVELYRQSEHYNLGIIAITTRFGVIEDKLRYELERSGTVLLFRSRGKDARIFEKMSHCDDGSTPFEMLKHGQVYIRTLQAGDPLPWQLLSMQ